MLFFIICLAFTLSDGYVLPGDGGSAGAGKPVATVELDGRVEVTCYVVTKTAMMQPTTYKYFAEVIVNDQLVQRYAVDDCRTTEKVKESFKVQDWYGIVKVTVRKLDESDKIIKLEETYEDEQGTYKLKTPEVS